MSQCNKTAQGSTNSEASLSAPRDDVDEMNR
jgi:hypothetical protein